MSKFIRIENKIASDDKRCKFTINRDLADLVINCHDRSGEDDKSDPDRQTPNDEEKNHHKRPSDDTINNDACRLYDETYDIDFESKFALEIEEQEMLDFIV
eukprot:352706_1